MQILQYSGKIKVPNGSTLRTEEKGFKLSWNNSGK